MFKVGDKVICVDNEEAENRLVKGKEYTVRNVGVNGICIEGLSGYQYNYRFKLKGKDMFTLEDIKEGYLVEQRSGEKMLVQKNIHGELFICNERTWSDDVVGNVENDPNFRQLDVVKVYGLVNKMGANMYNTKNRDLLWERKETKEMTVAEIEKELGYPIKVVK